MERELTTVDSDEEPLVRPSVGRNVIPRLFQTVPSEQWPFWLKPSVAHAEGLGVFFAVSSFNFSTVLPLVSKTDATTRMAGDRSAVRVGRGHPWTQTTSQKWPRASFHQLAQSRQPLNGPPVRQGGRWGQCRGIGRVGQSGQPNRARSPPEVAISAARQRVLQMEATLAALGDTGPEVTMLQMALKRAKQAAQEPDEFVRAVRHQRSTIVASTS